MRTKIRQRDFYEWPVDVQRVLWKLSFNDGSGLRDSLRDIRDHDVDHKTFVLFEEGNTPVSWGLAIWDDYEDVWDLMFYTRRDRRLMGYGRRVYKRAKEWLEDDKFAIFPDGTNTKFFETVDHGAL